ncbi:MAG TPA: CBS domain-containing protein [Candidatus Saccharimonadales bacterium]|nr:CBS domain-containing protein [Candidatus Saccharimonadales bacterium]
MVEVIVLIVGFILAILIALTKSFNLGVSSISSFELERRRNSGDKSAARELSWRALAPTFEAAKNIKIMVLLVILVSVVAVALPTPWGFLASLVFALFAQIAAARGWFLKPAANLQKKYEPQLRKYLLFLKKYIGIFVTPVASASFSLNSVEELEQLITLDQNVLSEHEKTQLLAVMQFENLKVEEVMVKRDQIVVVGIKETVGPLLLDKLHKAGHNIFPVVDKSLDHVKGLLYMSDLVPLDPELKEVREVVRPNVYSLQQDASLSDVLAASIKTGRQLFFVSKGEKIIGLITLSDVLAKMTGQKIAKEVKVNKI